MLFAQSRRRNCPAPDDGFAPASDSQSVLLARINRISLPEAGPVETVGAYQGNFGFIID